MTIRTQLRSWFLLLAAVMIGLLVASFWASKTLEGDLDRMIDCNLAESAAVHELIATLTDIEVYVLKISPEGDAAIPPAKREENRAVLSQYARRFESSLAEAHRVAELAAKLAPNERAHAQEEGEAVQVASLQQRFQVFMQQLVALPAFRKDEDPHDPPKNAEEVLAILQDELEPRMLHYMSSSIEEQQHFAAATQKTSVYARHVFLGWAIGAVALIVAGLMFITRAVRGPLDYFAGAARKISEGDRDLRLRYGKRDEFGELAGALDTMLDSLRASSISRHELEGIVRRRTAELQASRENLQITLDSIGDGVLATDAQGRVTGLNPVAEQLTGWKDREAAGRPVEEIFKIVHEESRTPLLVPVGEVLTTGEEKELANHTLLLGRYGRETPVADSCAPIRDAEKRVIGAVLVFRDVTAERAAKKAIVEANARLEKLVTDRTSALMESDRRHRTLLANLQGMAYRCVPQGEGWRFSFISEGSRRLLGLAPEALVGGLGEVLELVHPEDRAQVRSEVCEALRARKTFTIEFRARHADGDWHWLADQGQFIWNARGEPEAIEGYMSDISERKLTELTLRRLSNELAEASGSAFFEAVATQVADLLGAEIGFVGKVVSEKPPRLRVVGFTLDGQPQPTCEFDTTGSPCEKLGEKKAQIITAGLVECFPQDARLSAWGVVGYAALPLMNAAGRVVGRLGVMSRRPLQHPERIESILQLFSVRVVTEFERMQADEDRRALETQLRQSQKMEALGTLAGGIAHDFNNVLGGIVGYSELLKPEMTTPDQKEYLHMIEVSTGRARNLVKQILTFSRRTETQRIPLRLPGLVEEVTKLLRATLPAMVQLRSHIEANPLILADPTQIHQVLLNLCTNAWQALPERGGGIDVSISLCSVSEELARAHADLRPGPHALLRVADNGSGMDAATLARIFDPFFTTKPAGKGTGLGLAVVHGIMQLHQGTIIVQSTPGQGSTFDLYFPVVEAEVVPPASQAIESLATKPGAGQHVLLVDDESIIALSTERLLKRAGYRVTMKDSAEEALAAFRADPGSIELLITDLAMSGMTGLELAAETRQLRPDLPIILMTGYLDPDLQARVRELKIDEILKKPVMAARLEAAITKVLARQTQSNR